MQTNMDNDNVMNSFLQNSNQNDDISQFLRPKIPSLSNKEKSNNLLDSSNSNDAICQLSRPKIPSFIDSYEVKSRKFLFNSDQNDEICKVPKSKLPSFSDFCKENEKIFDQNQNKDEVIDTENDDKWQKYCKECRKWFVPPISAVKDYWENESSELDLSNYMPQSIGIRILCDSFCELPVTKLMHLNLSNCPFGVDGCCSLGNFIESSVTLTRLNLSNCRIGLFGCQALEKGLIASKFLRYINLSGCNIRDDGGVVVANALKTNDSCEYLDVGRNELFIKSGIAFGQLLAANRTISSLELGWNNLSSETDCIPALLRGLGKNKNLRYFGLSWNGLSGDIFAVELRKALGKNNSLEILNLENNRLFGIGNELAIGFSKAKQLETVLLAGNPLTNDDIESILNIFKNDVNVKELNFGKDTWWPVELSDLAKMYKTTNNQIEIMFGGTIRALSPEPVDFRAILIERGRFLAAKPKKKKFKKDFGHFFLQLKNENLEYCSKKEFVQRAIDFKAKINIELYEQMADEWIVHVGVNKQKSRKVSIVEMANYYLNRYATEPPVAKVAKKKKKTLTKRKI